MQRTRPHLLLALRALRTQQARRKVLEVDFDEVQNPNANGLLLHLGLLDFPQTALTAQDWAICSDVEHVEVQRSSSAGPCTESIPYVVLQYRY